MGTAEKRGRQGSHLVTKGVSFPTPQPSLPPVFLTIFVFQTHSGTIYFSKQCITGWDSDMEGPLAENGAVQQGDEPGPSLAAVVAEEQEQGDAKLQEMRRRGEGQYGCKHYRPVEGRIRGRGGEVGALYCD